LNGGHQMKKIGLLILALACATPATARSVKATQPFPAELVGAAQIVETRVVLSEEVKANFAKLEHKAADKRAAAGLQPVAEDQTFATRPTEEEYATLPITRMMPLVMEDTAHEWGLVAGRPIRLTIELDTLKTADAGMAMLFGSSDQLAGMVTITDPATDQKLGEYYIDVLNGRGGLLGLAMRGSGVREKLAAEFSDKLMKELAGKRKKTKS